MYSIDIGHFDPKTVKLTIPCTVAVISSIRSNFLLFSFPVQLFMFGLFFQL